ncbi:predicted signal transduction protein [Marinobacter sp. ELB17]|nr:predicted signal transduction protein [Marinobacter sp. ELB17]
MILVLLLLSFWQSIIAERNSVHSARVALVAQSIDSVLRTQELLLTVVGREILRAGNLPQTPQHSAELDRILQENPVAIGLGMARSDGQLMLVSSNLDLGLLPNLLRAKTSRDSFQEALATDTMVLGRTYFMGAINKWTIPVRKALRNPQGEVVAVMTAGLRIDGRAGVLSNSLYSGAYDRVMLTRASDGYVQFISEQGTGPEQYSKLRYQAQTLVGQIPQSENLSPADTQQSDTPYTYRIHRDQKNYLGAAQFNNRFQMWVMSETLMRPLWVTFFKTALLYVSIFLGSFLALFIMFRIIAVAEAKRLKELMYLSRHDELTGVGNRSGLSASIKSLLRRKQSFMVAVINIDHFRGVNDRFGQEYGDQVLCAFARRLLSVVDDKDVVARLGADEFVLLIKVVNLQALESHARQLSHQLDKPLELEQFPLQLGASIGVAVSPRDGDSVNTLLRSAHLALYQAKKSRNDWCLYREELEQAYIRRVQLEQRLRQALSLGQLTMVFQPQVDHVKVVYGYEALVRWYDEELGQVGPDEFVGVAESSGLMPALGQFVMETSVREFSEFVGAQGEMRKLAVNISVLQFLQPGFAKDVLSLLSRYGLSPKQLVLEMTESLFISNFDDVLAVLNELRKQGVRVSMDDFGTGYSSLSLLRTLPLDELKIDKTFIDGLLDDHKVQNMVASIISIARSHQLELVAEGVETEGQYLALMAMGCKLFQGYYFGRPAALSVGPKSPH